MLCRITLKRRYPTYFEFGGTGWPRGDIHSPDQTKSQTDIDWRPRDASVYAGQSAQREKDYKKAASQTGEAIDAAAWRAGSYGVLLLQTSAF